MWKPSNPSSHGSVQSTYRGHQVAEHFTPLRKWSWLTLLTSRTNSFINSASMLHVPTITSFVFVTYRSCMGHGEDIHVRELFPVHSPYFTQWTRMNPHEVRMCSYQKPRKWPKITKLLQLYKLHLAPSGSKLEKMTDAQDKELTVSAIGDTFRQIIGHMKVGGWVCKLLCKLCNAA